MEVMAQRALFVVSLQLLPVACEFISDLGSVVRPSAVDESQALEIKAEQFWQTVLTSAEDIKMVEHLNVYAEVDKVLAELPQENEFVREGLSEAVKRLRRADEMVLVQAVKSSDVASARLASPADKAGFSFFTSGNFMQKALQRFVSGGRYSERLLEHVEHRQADILPVLEGVAGSSGNVLDDVRQASKTSFDVLKYDIYNKGVPKTPQAAKDVAYKLIDATGETRHRFMQFITQTVTSIGNDFKDRKEGATVTVARTALRSMESPTESSAPEEILNL